LTSTPSPYSLAAPSFPTRRSSDLSAAVRLPSAGAGRRRRVGRHGASVAGDLQPHRVVGNRRRPPEHHRRLLAGPLGRDRGRAAPDRKSTRLNSSHVKISYAVFCLI